MKYLVVDTDGNATLLQTDAPAQEDFKAIDGGSISIFQLEVNLQGDVQVRWPELTFMEGEGDDEEDEYEVEWKLVT